jgi:3-isopropylmalate/(R)-2-methylmalate dehydratase small subunit
MNISGRALVLRGDDIDTDRIMPARFLRAVSFDGLEAHVFEDDRRALAGASSTHPFDRPENLAATVLLVNKNFGCGSSREHAPQGIARWGIKAIVGESFAEIFFANATALGVPCVTVSADDAQALMRAVEADRTIAVEVDVSALEVRTGAVAVDVAAREAHAGASTARASMPASAREAFLSGTWDATALLTADFDVVRQAASRLPYIAGF